MSNHFRIFLAILLQMALMVCVLSELPPVLIYCQSKVLDSEDLPFYEESSYSDAEVLIANYSNSGEQESVPYIYALFTEAKFIVENTGSKDLSFVYSATVINTTEGVTDIPDYTFGPEDDVDVIPAGSNLTILFQFNTTNYEGPDNFQGQLILLVAFKDTEKAYDVVSLRANAEVFVPGCSEECNDYQDEGKGTCIYKVGYCKCQEPWTGKTCKSSFKLLNNRICPGEPLYISYQLVSASCRGYWSIYPRGDVDPTYETGNLYSDNCEVFKPIPQTNVTLMKYLEPGFYRFAYFMYFGAEEDGEVEFEVKQWGDEDCEAEYFCSADKGKVCSGFGECVDNEIECEDESEGESGVCHEYKCECKDSHFWQDCSRGCSLETRLTDRSGVIDSDSGSSVENRNPLYVQNTNCTWYIIPEGRGVDRIFLNFTRFKLASSSDVLYVRSLNKNNEIDKNSKILAKHAYSQFPQSQAYDANKIALVFVSSYQGSSLGFRVEYEVITDDMDSGVIVAIVLVSVAVVAAIITLIVLMTVRRKKQRDDL